MYLPANVAPQPPLPPEPLLDLHRLIRIARRRLRLMAIFFLTILAAVAIATMTMKPVYTASLQLMIDKPSAQILAKEDNTSALSQSALDASIIETEVEVLRSPALAESVVRDLRLGDDPEFNSALAAPGPLARLKAVLRRGLPASQAPQGPRRDPVAEALRGRLKVSRMGTSYIIKVEVSSSDPVKSARIANAFASNYLRSQLDAKFNASRDANAWLYSRIGELRQRVLTAEAALQNYKIENNLLSAQGATLTEQEISGLNQQAALARAQQAEAQARLSTAMSQLANGSTGDDVGETLTSPVIQQLRHQRAMIAERMANLQSRYGPRHPDIIKTRNEIGEIDDQIRAEIKRIMSNLQAQAVVARERNASLESSVARSRAGLADSNRSLVRLNELQRDADAERTLYESFLSKFKELSAQAGLARTDAHVVSPALAPNGPSAPNAKLNLLLGSVLGLAAAVTAALVRELFEKGLTDSQLVERELSVAYLGSIPSLRSIATPDDALRNRPIDHLAAKPISAFAESFRSLRANIDYARQGAKVVAVTSSLSGEGKTTTSIGLARSAALGGVRSVIVDCDLRQQSVNRVLEIAPSVGLVEVLNGWASLDEALMLDETSGAMVLPLLECHLTPEDLFNAPAMGELIQQLRQRFDLVILDTAPIILVTEARTVTRYADAVVLLVHWRRTPRVLVQTALRLLANAGAKLAGVALTQVDLRRPASIDPADPTAYYLSHKNYYVH